MGNLILYISFTISIFSILVFIYLIVIYARGYDVHESFFASIGGVDWSAVFGSWFCLMILPIINFVGFPAFTIEAIREIRRINILKRSKLK